MFSTKKFLKKHPCALGVCLFFIMGLTSYELISADFGYENNSREQLGSTYSEYMIYMMFPVTCLAAVPFLWGMWFNERKYRKRDSDLLRGEEVEQFDDSEETIKFIN